MRLVNFLVKSPRDESYRDMLPGDGPGRPFFPPDGVELPDEALEAVFPFSAGDSELQEFFFLSEEEIFLPEPDFEDGILFPPLFFLLPPLLSPMVAELVRPAGPDLDVVDDLPLAFFDDDLDGVEARVDIILCKNNK